MNEQGLVVVNSRHVESSKIPIPQATDHMPVLRHETRIAATAALASLLLLAGCAHQDSVDATDTSKASASRTASPTKAQAMARYEISASRFRDDPAALAAEYYRQYNQWVNAGATKGPFPVERG